jgi:acyl transferase domain-containing protein/acyl carrier protein
MTSFEPPSNNDIAIIGMSGRFPGAATVRQFWHNVRNGRETVSRFTKEDLVEAGVDPQALNYPGYVNAAGVLDDIELFDAGFFGFNARDAEITDPQHRLFLECSWEALEDGGYDPARFDGQIGVFGGMAASRYAFYLYSNPELIATVGQMPVMLGTDKDHLTTRVSYKLNLKGPAVTVQTACSTSLVAVVLACQSVLEYHCDMALAGGVTILLPQKTGYMYQPGSINSPDGHCRAFDADAMGTVGGNGVGVVLLKRYSEALADGDSIYAVIKGAAINNDGSVKVGYTAPSVDGQAAVIATAQAIAGVSPQTIGYIEAHGTGTPLGDPIEIAALTQVFRAGTSRLGYCALGSVKTNIGHLDCAAGVAGLIKTAMALQHRELPPSLHFHRPNPKIDFAGSPFYVNTASQPWTSTNGHRRAGVSAFGIGGTNAHVVLEEAPSLTPAGESRRYSIVPLSARSPAALDAMSVRLSQFLTEEPTECLADIAFTSAQGRRLFPHRRALVGLDAADATRVLAERDSTRIKTGTARANAQAVFIFPGQGAQHVGMGRDLYQREPSFKRDVERCCEFLHRHAGLDLLTVIYPPDANRAASEEQLDRTAITQPALFVMEYALARLLERWGVRPHAMIGHSIGEYVAACLAGVFTLEVALELVAARGRLMQQAEPGAMLAVSLSERELAGMLDAGLELAAVNGPLQTTVSGSFEAIDRLTSRLERQGVSCRRLKTSHAFHSRSMEPAVAGLRATVSRFPLAAPSVPFISNVTGDWITSADATDPGYWARHLRVPVRFGDGLDRLMSMPEWALIEVGPGVALSTLARQHPARRPEQTVTATMRHAKDSRHDDGTLLEAVAQLWTAGVHVNWSDFYAGERRRRVHLPTYPFERERYWIEMRRPMAPAAELSASVAPGGDGAREWLYRPVWKKCVLASENGSSGIQGARWLVLSDDRIGPALVERIRSEGGRVTAVRTTELQPDRADDYVSLLDRLDRERSFPDRIVHLWTTGAEGANDGALPPYQRVGFYSLLALAQALAKRAAHHPIQLLVVSDSLHSIESEAVVPEKATVIGPVRVVPQELPHIWCRSVDLQASFPDASIPSMLDALCREFTDSESHPLVAHRNDARWVQIAEPIARETEPQSQEPLRHRGSYLVTGGTGGIGLVLAEHLARTVGARLTLIARTPLPDRAAWVDWLREHDDSHRTSRTLRRILAIEAAGGEVLVVAADVADREQLAAALRASRERFGALHGVIHSAGVAGGGMIQRRTIDAARRVLAPKLEGMLMLESLLRDEPLDFMVLCSSLASLLGGFAQIDYCAANAFLDAYAESASTRLKSARTVAIGWDAWQEVGMAVETAVPRELMAARDENLKHGLRNEEGVLMFQRALRSSHPRIMVSRDLGARATLIGRAVAAPAPPATSPAAARHARPALEVPLVLPRTETESTIASIWEEMLGVAPVGVDDDFFVLGGHSLLAIQVVARLRDKLGVDVPVQVLFDAPTVAQLAIHVEASGDATAETARLAEMIQFVEQLSDEEVQRMLASRRAEQGG